MSELLLTPVLPLHTQNKRQCLFCTSRNCATRIINESGLYDQIACNRHVRDLEKHADAILCGAARIHITATLSCERGKAREEFAERKAILDALPTRKGKFIDPEEPGEYDADGAVEEGTVIQN